MKETTGNEKVWYYLSVSLIMSEKAHRQHSAITARVPLMIEKDATAGFWAETEASTPTRTSYHHMIKASYPVPTPAVPAWRRFAANQ